VLVLVKEVETVLLGDSDVDAENEVETVAVREFDPEKLLLTVPVTVFERLIDPVAVLVSDPVGVVEAVSLLEAENDRLSVFEGVILIDSVILPVPLRDLETLAVAVPLGVAPGDNEEVGEKDLVGVLELDKLLVGVFDGVLELELVFEGVRVSLEVLLELLVAVEVLLSVGDGVCVDENDIDIVFVPV
jgi:hypothetical protein